MSRVSLALESATRLQRPRPVSGVLRRGWSLDLLRHRVVQRWDVEAQGLSPEPPENLRRAVLEQFPPKARRLAR